jgi:hypothetical protein
MFTKGEKVQYRNGYDRAFIVTKIDGDKVWLRVARLARYDRQRFETATVGELQPYSDAAKVAREAAKARKAKTCQICGRAIHAAKGVIAHHGYERPAHGWQTSSCYGARHAPFEVSRDTLGMYIETALYNTISSCERRVAALQVAGVEVPGPSEYKRSAEGKVQYDHRGRTLYHNPLIGADHERYSWFLAEAQKHAAGELAQWRQHRVEQQARFDGWKPKGA